MMNMNFKSKKIALPVLAVISLVCSGVIFSFSTDPEGPNLVVVVGLAAIIFAVCLVVYAVLFRK